jgi:hypothetical protein
MATLNMEFTQGIPQAGVEKFIQDFENILQKFRMTHLAADSPPMAHIWPTLRNAVNMKELAHIWPTFQSFFLYWPTIGPPPRGIRNRFRFAPPRSNSKQKSSQMVIQI